jgi:hypothetical protein
VRRRSDQRWKRDTNFQISSAAEMSVVDGPMISRRTSDCALPGQP